jgi:DNA-binding CsgD family transcriptional regulator
MGALGSNRVWARAVVAAAETASLGNLPVDRLFEDLPFDERSVRRMWMVSWDDYATVVERFEELAGGPQASMELLKSSYHSALPEVRKLAGALISPKALCLFLMQVVDPFAFEPMTWHTQDLGGDHLRFKVDLRPGHRPCLAFFHGTIGAIAGVPCHLGLPPAEVEADVGPTHGYYEVRLPKSATVLANGGRVARGLFERFLPQIGVLNGDAPDHGDRDATFTSKLATATHTWALSPRQEEVLKLLVRGEANKEIAQALECAENTVELHVTELFRKSGAPTRAKLIARFWSEL